jgi:hypothetical protein
MMRKFRSTLIVLLISMLAIVAVGCSQSESPSQTAATQQKNQPVAADPQVATTNESQATQAAEPAQTAQQVSPQKLPPTMEISGLVEKADEGIVIVTDLGRYNVLGQDLSNLVGKTVKVTGAVKESDGQYTIDVLSVSESK